MNADLEQLALAVEAAGPCEFGCGRDSGEGYKGGPGVGIVTACPVHGQLAREMPTMKLALKSGGKLTGTA